MEANVDVGWKRDIKLGSDVGAKVDSEGSLKVGSIVGGEVGLSVVVKCGSEGRWRARKWAWAPIWVAIIVGLEHGAQKMARAAVS